MTAEQLEELLGRVTPEPWWTDARYNGREMGCAIIAARTDCGPLPGNPTRGMVAWSSATLNTEARRCEANARLIALAPSLARRVLAAEKIVSAYEELIATVEGECSSLLDPCRGGSDVLCNLVLDAEEALTAYREASK